MFYQYQLLKKKGQFGVVWLAAHYPSKLTKHDILSFDVESKCQEILEFITNGKYNKPRLSIKLSSYLMYGLVVIYQRKANYYYNELAQINLELKPSFVTAALKAQQKTPRKPRAKKTQGNKSALEMKENLPEDFTFDMSFRIPEELDYEMEIPVDRIRDITLAETEIEQYHLMHPIPMETTYFELPPAPSQFLFEKPEELAKHLMGTSTARKPVEKRTPLGEIDQNRLSQIGIEDDLISARRGLFEVTTDIQMIEPIPEETPMPAEKQPEPVREPEQTTIIQPLEITRPAKKVSTRKNIQIDKTTMLSDTDMKRQIAHVSKPPHLQIKQDARAEFQHLNLFKMTTQEALDPQIFKLPKHLRTLNVFHRMANYTHHTEIALAEPFETTIQSSESDLAEILKRRHDEQKQTDASRRRAARSGSLLIQQPEGSIQAITETEIGSKIGERTELLLQPLEEEHPMLDYQQQSEQFEAPQFVNTEIEPQITFQEEHEIHLNANDENFLNEIKINNKYYFHDIAPIGTTTRKISATFFSKLLKLAANKKIKPIQTEMYGPIKLELI